MSVNGQNIDQVKKKSKYVKAASISTEAQKIIRKEEVMQTFLKLLPRIKSTETQYPQKKKKLLHT